MNALMQDPNVAAGAFISNYRDGYYLSEAIYRVIETRSVKKPTNRSRWRPAIPTWLIRLSAAGRTRPAYRSSMARMKPCCAFKHLFDYHKFKRNGLQAASPPGLDA